MKILKKIGLILLLIIAILCIYVAFLPSTFKVERSIVINSSESVVWNGINKLENFKLWNPWLLRDTATKTTITGKDGELGGSFAWNSDNKDVGSGQMTISNVVLNKQSDYDLKFLKPFESSSKVSMAMEKAENGFKTTWSMSGEQGFFEKLIMLAMGGMDGAVGNDFETGLQTLKKLCENGTIAGNDAIQTVSYEVKDIEFPSTLFASIRSKMKFEELPSFFEASYGKIMSAASPAGVKPNGPACSIYYMYDEKVGITDVAAAMPMDKEAKLTGVTWVKVEAKKAHQIVYFGDYKKMMPAYQTMSSYMKSNNLGDEPELVIEQYITDPMMEKDTAKWQTNIIFFEKTK